MPAALSSALLPISRLGRPALIRSRFVSRNSSLHHCEGVRPELEDEVGDEDGDGDGDGDGEGDVSVVFVGAVVAADVAAVVWVGFSVDVAAVVGVGFSVDVAAVVEVGLSVDVAAVVGAVVGVGETSVPACVSWDNVVDKTFSVSCWHVCVDGKKQPENTIRHKTITMMEFNFRTGSKAIHPEYFFLLY
jgi:hypothetical protein